MYEKIIISKLSFSIRHVINKERQTKFKTVASLIYISYY